MLLIVKILDTFKENRYLQAVFYGLRPAVTGLIAAAGVTVAAGSLLVLPYSGDVLSLFNLPAVGIFVVVFCLIRRFKIHPVWYLLLSAGVGVLFGYLPL